MGICPFSPLVDNERKLAMGNIYDGLRQSIGLTIMQAFNENEDKIGGSK